MKTIVQKLISKKTLSFESIYHNEGFAADAFHFNLIEPKKNGNKKSRVSFSRITKAIRVTCGRMLYSTILLSWFSFYFVVFGTIKLFSLIKL